MKGHNPARVLVTGGAGFIGSHVVTSLVINYPSMRVYTLDKLDYCASIKNLEDVMDMPNHKFIKGDICSPDFVNYVLKNEEIDTIIHLAAHTHVDNSFGNSINFSKTNCFGTHVLLEAAKNLGEQIKRFIHVSTDEVYGESDVDSSPFEEGAVLEPSNPYAASKAAAELVAKAYYKSFDVPVIITRGNNVFGPNQYPEKLVPKFITQMMRNMPLTVHGQGETRRNYLYISDVVDALSVILFSAKPGTVINIGGDEELSVLEIGGKILKLFNRESESETWIQYTEDRNFNDQRYNIDSTKLWELGWSAKVTFDEGLKKTFEWYKQNLFHWGNVDHAIVAHPRINDDLHEPPFQRKN